MIGIFQYQAYTEGLGKRFGYRKEIFVEEMEIVDQVIGCR